MTKDQITALARKHGTSYTNRHFLNDPAFAFGNESWTKFCDALVAAQPPTVEARGVIEPMYLDGVNTERLSQALTWMGVDGPVSKESYVSDMAFYVNVLASAVMAHKRATETSFIAQPVQQKDAK